MSPYYRAAALYRNGLKQLDCNAYLKLRAGEFAGGGFRVQASNQATVSESRAAYHVRQCLQVAYAPAVQQSLPMRLVRLSLILSRKAAQPDGAGAPSPLDQAMPTMPVLRDRQAIVSRW